MRVLQLHGVRSVAVPPTSETILSRWPVGIAADTKKPPRARKLQKLAGSPGGTCGNSDGPGVRLQQQLVHNADAAEPLHWTIAVIIWPGGSPTIPFVGIFAMLRVRMP